MFSLQGFPIVSSLAQHQILMQHARIYRAWITFSSLDGCPFLMVIATFNNNNNDDNNSNDNNTDIVIVFSGALFHFQAPSQIVASEDAGTAQYSLELSLNNTDNINTTVFLR